jgi:hypothetical protein
MKKIDERLARIAVVQRSTSGQGNHMQRNKLSLRGIYWPLVWPDPAMFRNLKEPAEVIRESDND